MNRLALAILAALVLVGCSSSHLQFFRTGEEGAFSAWVETYRGMPRAEAVAGIAAWMHDNMQYEPGSAILYPGYLDAWNQRTNCAGFARVAVEALHRLDFTDFVMVAAYHNYTDKWHVIATDRMAFYTSNGSFAPLVGPQTPEALATLAQPDWVTWQIRDRNLNILEEGSR